MDMKKIQRIFCVTMFVFALLLHGGNDRAWGAPVCLEQARRVVENWLTFTPCPLDTPMGCRIDEIIHYKGGPYGDAGYYVAFLAPCGWVAVPADDTYEPIMAFGGDKITEKEWRDSLVSILMCTNIEQHYSTDAALCARRDKPFYSKLLKLGVFKSQPNVPTSDGIHCSRPLNEIVTMTRCVLRPMLKNMKP